MEDRDKVDCARSWRSRLDGRLLFAEERSSKLADEFTRLEVQIATILFALIGFFLSSLPGKAEMLSGPGGLAVKVALIASLFFLVSSLGLGLLHMKRKEKFWDEIVIHRANLVGKWEEVEQGKTDFEKAEAFQDGALADKPEIMKSPLWTWILQTICLAMSIVLLFSLFIVFLF